MPSMNRTQFLETYEYAVEQDWSLDGVPAEWATSDRGAHRLWGQEDDKMDVKDATGLDATASSVSPDGAFLAVSNGNTISVYNLDTKQKISHVAGPLEDVAKLYFRHAPLMPDGSKAAYLLLSQSSEPSGRNNNTITFWDLDSDGKPLQQVQEPIEVPELAQQSLDAITPLLSSKHGIGADSETVRNILKDYGAALQPAAATIRTRGLHQIGGRLPHFDSQLFSASGKYLCYLAQNKTTQHGMRPPDDLPLIVIYDLETRTVRHELRGHTDAIMFAAFSPDDQTLASAAWDGWFYLWDVENGKQLHKIGPTGGQNWDGCWSPDSKHILFSGMAKTGEGTSAGPTVALYDRETGSKVAEFHDERLQRWVRVLAFRENDTISIGCTADIWIWKAFEAADKAVATHFQVGLQDRIQQIFLTILKAKWVDDGQKLLVATGEHTVEVFDVVKNVKWRFQRPKGTQLGGGFNMFWLGDNELAVLSGDGVVRFWKL